MPKSTNLNKKDVKVSTKIPNTMAPGGSKEDKKPQLPSSSEIKGPRVKTTREIKFKDKPNRNFIVLDFMKGWGFLPERIVVEKVRGQNNKIQIHIVLTPAEIKKEDKEIAKHQAKQKKALDKHNIEQKKLKEKMRADKEKK